MKLHDHTSSSIQIHIPVPYRLEWIWLPFTALKHFKYIMFPAIKPFRMQPNAGMRQPHILKVSPWQPVLRKTGAQQGGYFGEGLLAVIMHNNSRHTSQTGPASLLRPARRRSAASVLFWRWRIYLSFGTLKFTWTDFIQTCSFLSSMCFPSRKSLLLNPFICFYIQRFDVLQRIFLLYCVFIYCWCYYISIT